MQNSTFHSSSGEIKNLILLVLIASLFFFSPAAASQPVLYNVTEYGAVGDGKTKDTQAIQAAIQSANDAGGGTVYFPAGTYLSGTIILKDHVTLFLEAGSILLGSTDIADYPSTPPKFRSYTENYFHQSLIYGEDLENITIRGRGTIDGQGTTFNDQPFRKRPCLIRLVTCRNVQVRDITLINSAFWVQHYLACDDLVISGIRVNSMKGVNNDGCDIDCCRNVRISDCYIHSADDALVLKSTSNQTCENVTITNCVLSTESQGFKLGTESNGGFRNITMTNCTIRKPGLDELDWDRVPRGVAAIGLLMIDGGILERINVSDITVRGMASILFIRVRNRARTFSPMVPNPGIGIARDVHISNIIARDIGPRGADITGLPGHPVENITISNIDVIVEGGEKAFLPGYVIKEVLEGDPALKLDHATKMKKLLPSYGFYCRHVKGLRFDNINFGWEKPDYRPALICEDVQNLEIDRYQGPGISDNSPMIVQRDVSDVFIRGCVVPENTGVFLKFEGQNNNITVMGNDLSRAKIPFDFAEGSSDSILVNLHNRMK
jgi:hypothetical protein